VTGYILIFHANLGVIGAGASISISEIVQFFMNERYLGDIAEQDQIEVSIMDVKLSYRLFATYCKKAFPGVLKQVLEHGIFVFLILDAGAAGGQGNQAKMAIFFVYQGLFYNIGLGMQSCSCQFIGHYLGMGHFQLARRYYRYFICQTGFMTLFILCIFLLLLGLRMVLWVDIPIVS